MAESEKPKPIDHDELAGMSREYVKKNWSKVKKRLKVSIPAASEESGDQGDDDGAEEKLTAPEAARRARQRMERGHRKNDEARAGTEGGDDGSSD